MAAKGLLRSRHNLPDLIVHRDVSGQGPAAFAELG